MKTKIKKEGVSLTRNSSYYCASNALRPCAVGVIAFAVAILPILHSVSFAAGFTSGVIAGDVKEFAIRTEHFQIEYSHIIGLQTDSDGDSISDIVEQVSEYAERSWDMEVDNLGFDEPVSDDKYVYIILDDNDEYLWEGTTGVSSVFDDLTPYMAIDPWLDSDILKVTVAHEFMHVIHFGYDPYFIESYQDINFAEATAVWAEDYVYDDVNDYWGYLIDYFNYPDYSIFAGVVPDGTLFEYALVVWPRFLTEYYKDDGMIYDFWDKFFELDSVGTGGFLTVFSAVSDIVEAKGDDLDEVYQDFSIWNLAKNDYYEEGEDYPNVYLMMTWDSYPVVNQMPLPGMRPALYGTNYIVFEMPEGDGDLKFALTKPVGIEMGVSFVPVTTADNFDLSQVDKTIISEDDTYVELIFDGASRYDKVYVVVSPLGAQLTGDINVFDNGYAYYYSADFGDYSESDEVTSSADVEIEQEAKEGQEFGANPDGVKVSDELTLEVAAYDDESVTLKWNRLSGLDIDHYLLYFGDESGSYMGTDEIDQAWTTTSSVPELAPGQVYYFVVEAYSVDDELLAVSGEVVAETSTFSFTDLDSGDESYEAVMGLYEMGVINGYSDGSFGADQTVNRAELLKILIEGRGIEVRDDYANCFLDVGDEWYAKYVCYAEEQGWVSGYEDGNFYPAQTVNKVEALKMLFMVYGYDLEEGAYISGKMPYADTWPTAWYAVYVDTAFDMGLLSEEEGDVFAPEEGRDRGEICMELWGMVAGKEP